ncbi:MAG TPA: DUF1512 domain-containing protein [Candidatus Bathyarchaeota archaeon]|nr:DUF1512 domain-containing protein [Candidatus Bathyarchaeota archaeon]
MFTGNLAPKIQQPLAQDTMNWIFQLIWILAFIIIWIYGQRIQTTLMLREIEGSLFKLKAMRDKGRQIAISTIKEVGKPAEDPTARVDRLLEHVDIGPVSLDPTGIIRRLEHIINVRDFRLKDEIRHIAPHADEDQINNLTNLIEAALALNQIYKTVRHYYLMGKKTLSFYIILQIQMILPLIMRESEAFVRALRAFTLGQPIGDGAGALVAARLMHGKEKRLIAQDTVVSEVDIEGRKAYVIKAKGPGGNVGRPGEAIKQILEEKEGKVALIIIIDAAQKLEGEKPGEVVEGVGVAIGGPGVDKYKVEEVAAKYGVPLSAVLIKESIEDVISTMRKEIVDGVEESIERIKRLIRENTKEGDTIIIAGIGNTIGIAQ